MATHAKEFFRTIPDGIQASRTSPLVTSVFGQHRSIQGRLGWLWLIVKETNNQTATTEVPQRRGVGGGGVFPGIFARGMPPRSPFLIRMLLFLSDPFGIETISTFIHFRSFLKNHTRFQTNMSKIYTLFRPKRHKNNFPLGRHIPIWLI